MVDILLPVFNGEHYLADQIDSYFAQSYDNWKLIIRNDGSTDNSQSVINSYCEKFPEKIECILEPKENIGLVGSMNILLNHSDGDYIMFSDQDDVWLSEKIQISLDEVHKLEKEATKVPVMICTDAKCVDSNLNLIEDSFFRNQKFKDGVVGDTEKMLALNEVQGCTVMINRAAKDYIMPLPDFLHIHDMWIGVMISHYGKVSYIHKPTLLYRQHTKNTLGLTSVSLRYFINRGFKISYFIKSRYYLLKRLPFRINIPKWLWYKMYYVFVRI